MECNIDPALPHTRLPDMFASQRAALEAAMQRHSQCHRVRPGISSAARPLEIVEIPGVAPLLRLALLTGPAPTRQLRHA